MRIPRFLVKALLASMLLVNCTNSDELELPNQQTELNEVNKKEVAFKFIDLMRNQEFKDKTIEMLKDQQPSVALSKILEETKSVVGNEKSFKSLSLQTANLEEKANGTIAPEKIEILEVWMHNSKNVSDFSNVLFSFAPEGEEKNWSVVEAYTIDKKLVLLDAEKAPEQTVIVIETNGFETLKKEVAYMNKYLQEEGVQNERLAKTKMEFSPVSPRNAGLETSKLDKTRLNHDEEPWISGAAEVYAITSGIKDAGNNC